MAPANYTMYDVMALSPNRVLVHGSFRPQGSSVLVSADTAPGVGAQRRGFSVARTSQGLYTLTFDDNWKDMEACLLSVRKADGRQLRVQGGDWDASAKTLQFRTFQDGKGIIPLPLAQARELNANATINAAGNGGLLASDTTPILDVLTAAKEIGLTWAAGNTDEIAWAGLPLPPDFDSSVAATFKAIAEMGGATDTPTLTVEAFFGENGTDAGGATGALGAAKAVVSKALTQANQAAFPDALTVCLTPGAHANDTVRLFSAWIEYTSKMLMELADPADDVDNRVSFMAIFRHTDSGGDIAT